MLEEIRKGLLTGVGAVILTRDKIEKSIDQLVQDSKLAEEDARKLMDELSGSGQEQFSKIEKELQDFLKNAVSGMGITRKDEFQSLKQHVEALETRISLMEKYQNQQNQQNQQQE